MAKAKKKKPAQPQPPTSPPALPPTPKKRAWWLRWLVMPVLAVVISFHLLVASLLGLWAYLPVTNSMFMTLHRLEGGQVSQKWVDYEDIAKSAKQAVIASEDAKFVSHNGFDFDSIERAVKANEKAGAVSMGGSTITQQLVKNLFLSSHRSYVRKAEEAIITVMMEKMWSKRRILEVYLNVAEFGEGLYGIEVASWHYYGKPAKSLSREESALLISSLPRPKFYQKNRQNKRLLNKQRIILSRMNASVLPK